MQVAAGKWLASTGWLTSTPLPLFWKSLWSRERKELAKLTRINSALWKWLHQVRIIVGCLTVLALSIVKVYCNFIVTIRRWAYSSGYRTVVLYKDWRRKLFVLGYMGTDRWMLYCLVCGTYWRCIVLLIPELGGTGIVRWEAPEGKERSDFPSSKSFTLFGVEPVSVCMLPFIKMKSASSFSAQDCKWAITAISKATPSRNGKVCNG